MNCYSKYKVLKDELSEGELTSWEDGFPEMSNYTEDFKAWIDHIIISQNNLELVSLKEIPTIQ